MSAARIASPTRSRKRAPRVVETADYLAFTRRILAAMGRRATLNADALTELGSLSAELDAQLLRAVIAARRDGYSWTEVGQRLGMTKQGAQQRYGRRVAAAEAAAADLAS